MQINSNFVDTSKFPERFVTNGFRRTSIVGLAGCISVLHLRITGVRDTHAALFAPYSPGDKRKLSVAVAVVGLPNVVLLDEPTSGVDVASRTQIRRSLEIIRELSEGAMLLTSNRWVIAISLSQRHRSSGHSLPCSNMIPYVFELASNISLLLEELNKIKQT